MQGDISIWIDPDVRKIYDLQNGQPFPRFAMFNSEPDQLRLVHAFVEADQAAGSDGPASAFISACLAGIRLVEALPPTVEPGWLKFFIYQVDANNVFLSDRHHFSNEAAAIAEWTVVTLEQHDWGADGNTTALGQRHSNALAMAARAGFGVQYDPVKGKFANGDGGVARTAARLGGFGVIAADVPPVASNPADDQPLMRQARQHLDRPKLGAGMTGSSARLQELFDALDNSCEAYGGDRLEIRLAENQVFLLGDDLIAALTPAETIRAAVWGKAQVLSKEHHALMFVTQSRVLIATSHGLFRPKSSISAVHFGQVSTSSSSGPSWQLIQIRQAEHTAFKWTKDEGGVLARELDLLVSN